MIRLGALMSPELVEDLASTFEGAAVSVVNLGPCVSGMLGSDASRLHAIVVELSETVCDGDPREWVSAPIAGIPVSADSEDIAARYSIESVLRGPEDLERFVAALGPVEAPNSMQTGHIVAVWGPAGAPGRTTLAVATAAVLATRTPRVVLIDADTYAPALAPLMALGSATPGIVAASRIARVTGIESETLLGCCVPYSSGVFSLAVMTGLRSPTQFSDSPGTSWSRVVAALKDAGYVVVLDVAAPIEQFPHEVVGGPVRNGLAMATLEAADTVLAVARAEPLSVMRLSRSWQRYRELSPESVAHTVLNAQPPHSQGALDESTHALWQFTGQDRVLSIPYDRTIGQSAGSGAEAIIASALRGALATGINSVADAVWPAVPSATGRVGGSRDKKRGTVSPMQGWISRWLPRAGKRLL